MLSFTGTCNHGDSRKTQNCNVILSHITPRGAGQLEKYLTGEFKITWMVGGRWVNGTAPWLCQPTGSNGWMT